MLHMGYVDEVIFGKEVLSRLPELVHEWRAAFDAWPDEAKEKARVRAESRQAAAPAPPRRARKKR